ncbi:MAG: hypothetical protein FJX78_05995 [Armatimonadetes bacterium]|nr:hypothetical protein [Armatimonadota bacterium]
MKSGYQVRIDMWCPVDLEDPESLIAVVQGVRSIQAAAKEIGAVANCESRFVYRRGTKRREPDDIPDLSEVPTDGSPS